MKEFFVNTHKKIKNWLTQVLFKKYLTPFALILIYIFVVGPTSLVSRLFFKKALTKTSHGSESNWIQVENYEDSLEDSLKQS